MIPPIQKINSHAFFSPGEACLDAIISGLENTKNILEICVFTISDDRISAAILRAQLRGVSIRIITDNNKLFDVGSDIRELIAKGLEVRVDNTKNHMHHKFAVFDEMHVLTGSYNWTRSAALYNHENILVTDNLSIVQDYSREFDRLWNDMVVFDPNDSSIRNLME